MRKWQPLVASFCMLVVMSVAVAQSVSCNASTIATQALSSEDATTTTIVWVGSSTIITLAITRQQDGGHWLRRLSSHTERVWEMMCAIPFAVAESPLEQRPADRKTLTTGNSPAAILTASDESVVGIAVSNATSERDFPASAAIVLEVPSVTSGNATTCSILSVLPHDLTELPNFLFDTHLGTLLAWESLRSGLGTFRIMHMNGSRRTHSAASTPPLPPVSTNPLTWIQSAAIVFSENDPTTRFIFGSFIDEDTNNFGIFGVRFFAMDVTTNRSSLVTVSQDGSSTAVDLRSFGLATRFVWVPDGTGNGGIFDDGAVAVVTLHQPAVAVFRFIGGVQRAATNIANDQPVEVTVNYLSTSSGSSHINWGTNSASAPFLFGGALASATSLSSIVTLDLSCGALPDETSSTNSTTTVVAAVACSALVLLAIVGAGCAFRFRTNASTDGNQQAVDSPSLAGSANSKPESGEAISMEVLGDFHDPTDTRMVTLNMSPPPSDIPSTEGDNEFEADSMPDERHESRPLPSRTLQFQLGRPIGRGGFGTVYEALDVGSGQLLAVKEFSLVNCDASRLQDDLQMLRREIETMKSLRHPHIVRYYGAATDETRSLFLVMELMGGGSVHQMLRSFGALDHEAARRIVRQLLLALAYMHEKGLLHRDVKCANLLVGRDGKVKLGDFGTARHVGTVDGLAGTPNWMAPEVIREEPPTAASDMWAVGCVVMELLTGELPFAHVGTNFTVVMSVVADPTSIITLPASFNEPHPLHAVARRCLDRDPAARPTAAELLADPYFASA